MGVLGEQTEVLAGDEIVGGDDFVEEETIELLLSGSPLLRVAKEKKDRMSPLSEWLLIEPRWGDIPERCLLDPLGESRRLEQRSLPLEPPRFSKDREPFPTPDPPLTPDWWGARTDREEEEEGSVSA